MKTWSNGVMVEDNKEISSLNFALHYGGPTAWEGIRAYKQFDGTTSIFKLDAHVERLFNTAKIIGFEIPYTFEEVTKAVCEAVDANGGGDLYIRPIAYPNQDAESVRPHPTQEVSLDIYCFPIAKLHGKRKKGIKVAISGLIRSYPHYEMQAKTSHNYHFLQATKEEMKSRGVDDVLLQDTSGHITEAPVANIFVIKKGFAITPPNDGSILPGITRECVAGILSNVPKMGSNGVPSLIVAEKKVTKADLYTAEAVILCGTYAEIVNVLEVDGRKLPGSDYFEILKEEYQKLVRGDE